MKVIIVRSRAIDPSILKVARALCENGFKVNVLIWDRTCKFKNINQNKMSINYFKLRAPYDRLTVVFYLPIWWIYEFYFLLKNAHNDTVIHACDLDTLWPAIFAKILKRAKLNYMIYDFYADNLPKIIPKSLKRLIAFIEKKGLVFAETVFLVDESRIDQINGATYKSITYIYNTPEDALLQKQFKGECNDRDMVIFYAGVLHNSRGLKQIVQSIELIDNVKLVIAGDGPERNLFKNLNTNIANKIQYLGWIPYHEVIKYTIESDCIIALYDPSIPNNRYASPNKLFEAMMLAKPIIVNNKTSMANIVQSEKCGLIVTYDNVEAIRNAIVTLKNNPKIRYELGNNGRSAYEKKYSWTIMEKRLISVYENISKGSDDLMKP